ncbi:MAG: hypothetical protein ACRDZ5_02705 [Acidimicrobiales bacterium]
MSAMVSPERPDSTVMSALADDAAYEQRCADDALWTGNRLLIGLSAFAFASLGFSYFYLRSANNFHLWRPGGVTAPTGIGAAIFAVMVATAVLFYYGVRRLRAGSVVDWEVAGWVSVGGGLLALALQIWELTSLGFSPGSSGYASLFVAWGGLNIAVLVGVTYWVETLVARSLRLRLALREEGGANAQLTSPSFKMSCDAAAYFLWYVAGAELVFWILFYAI